MTIAYTVVQLAAIFIYLKVADKEAFTESC